jgi:4-amino-4-deoxy-L-arabinose transferase-like glycosyltransferase
VLVKKALSLSILKSPYVTLLLWVLPIVLLRSTQQSLMAHDEGIYATQARSILQTGDWVTPQWGGGYSFDRTIGIQWLIAVSYLLFGTSEETARLPSAIAVLLSVFLTYQIGCRLLNPRLAWLGAVIFSVIPLVAQYGRLATQDTVLMCVELIGIWALLNAEKIAPWALLAGSMFGVGFMIKGFMIIPATVALLPYLIRRYQHFRNPWLYGGFALGLTWPVGWLWAATQKYGNGPIDELFGKLFHLKGQTYQGAGPFYYFWNIPANGFPWVFFAIAGLWLIIRNPDIRALVKSKLLFIGFPMVLFVELTIFGTKTHYYPLQLMPFVGLFAAIALNYLGMRFTQGKGTRFFTGLNLIIGTLAMVFLIAVQRRTMMAEVLKLEWSQAQINRAAIVLLMIGLGWLSLPVIWWVRQRIGLWQSAKQWLAAWLLTSWLAISMLHLTGLWGNYNAKLKLFLQRSSVTEILQSHPVSFIVDAPKLSRNGRKTQLLLHFYTPTIGELSDDPNRLPTTDYAWIDPNLTKIVGSEYRVIDTFDGWILGVIRR